MNKTDFLAATKCITMAWYQARHESPLPEMGGVTGFYEARTDRVLCVRCAGTPALAGTPIAEPDCGDLHCSRCRQPLRPVNRRDEPNAAPGLFT